MAWRRCRASRGAWLGGEEEGVEAELEGVSERLRDGCGRGSGVGGDELRSVARGRESRGEEGVQRERGAVRGVSWLHQGVEGEAASRRWPGRVPARCGHTPSCPLARG